MKGYCDNCKEYKELCVYATWIMDGKEPYTAKFCEACINKGIGGKHG